MRRVSRSVMTWGAVGAMAGMSLIPVFNSKTRRKISRAARNAYFRVSDMMQDMKDMSYK